MPDLYLWNGGDNTDGLTWAKAKQTLLQVTAIASADQEIHAASDHVESEAGNQNYTTPDGVTVVSVNRTTGLYERGASITSTLGGDINLSNVSGPSFGYMGFDFVSGDLLTVSGSNATAVLTDCTIQLSLTSGGDYIGTTVDGVSLSLVDSTITFNNAAQGFRLVGGSRMRLSNCTVAGSGTLLFAGSGAGGGLTFEAVGCDFSGMDTGSTSGIFRVGANSADDVCEINLQRCLMPPFVTKVLETPMLGNNISVHLDSCSDLAGSGDNDAYYYTYFESFQGSVETDNAVTLGAMAYDGTDKASLELTSASAGQCTIAQPLRWKVAAIPVQDLTTSKTFTVEITSDSALTDADFWIEAVGGSSADFALGVTTSTRAADYLSGTTHTTSTATWTGSTGALTNKYKDSVTITGGGTFLDNSVVEIYAVLAKPAISVVVDPLIVVS